VNAVPYFQRVYEAHIAVLENLTPEQWELPTACAGWSVKDVALHMLGDDVGWISGRRDGFSERASFIGWDGLVAYLNIRNDTWLKATRRMSPRLICELVPVLGSLFIDAVESLDRHAIGPVVSWAGDEPAPQWLDTARELTERWMHHQHICNAVGIFNSLKESEIVHPVLDTFARALPRAYRNVAAPESTVVRLCLIGDGGGYWYLMREDEQWKLYSTMDLDSNCTVSLPVETAWRLFTKGITSLQARQDSFIEGDEALGEPILHMVSIIA
jgi:hypothetical protein